MGRATSAVEVFETRSRSLLAEHDLHVLDSALVILSGGVAAHQIKWVFYATG